jgi:hypothetical protein
MLPVLAPWVAGLLSLWFFARRQARVRIRACAWQALWPLSAVILFGLVHVEGRFVVPFFLLWFVYAYRSVSWCIPFRTRSAIIAAVSILGVMLMGAQVSVAAYRGVRQLVRHQLPDYVLMGRELQALRLQPGDGLAVVGNAFDAYYAWYSGMQVVAHLPDAKAFWQSSDAERDALLRVLATGRVHAIIAQDPPRRTNLAGWHEVHTPSARFVVLALPSPAPAR